jgi:PadR family transcriptional regulator PadR
MVENSNSAAVRSEAETWAAQLRKGSLELALLATLWHEPLYGLEVLRTLKASGLAIAEGTLYAILNRLRSDGLVASEWRDAGSGHPRKYYTLTEAGRASTKTMAAAWKEFSGQIDSILQPVMGREAKHAPTK